MFRQITYIAFGGGGLYRLTIDRYISVIRFEILGDHLHRRGLARPIGTKKTKDFACLYFEGNVVYCFLWAVTLSQTIYGYVHGNSKLGTIIIIEQIYNRQKTCQKIIPEKILDGLQSLFVAKLFLFLQLSTVTKYTSFIINESISF